MRTTGGSVTPDSAGKSLVKYDNPNGNDSHTASSLTGGPGGLGGDGLSRPYLFYITCKIPGCRSPPSGWTEYCNNRASIDQPYPLK